MAAFKGLGSTRIVPLVGAPLWAAQRVCEQHGNERFAFPKYNSRNTTNANSASAGLNKWIKTYAPAGCKMHGFYHSMRGRLRAVGRPADIVDQIGGWKTDGVGHSYGTGYPLEVLGKSMGAAAPCIPLAPSKDRAGTKQRLNI